MAQRIAKQCLFAYFMVALSLSVFSESGDEPTKYAIVVTGGELLRGVYADGHTQFITSTLEPLGAKCVSAVCVGDTAVDLQDALEFSFQHANLVLVTGGLGPTDDDVTRMTLSAFSGIELTENAEVINEMLRRYGSSSKESLRANMRRQAMTPTKGRYMPNPNGSAVGLIFDDGKRVIASMPGPPRELQPMVKEQLLPFLAERFGIKTIGTSLTMRFINIGESQIDETMHKFLTLPHELMVSSLFEMGRVDLTLSLPGNSEQDRQTLNNLEKELLAHIGDSMYTDKGETLEECVVRLLKQNKVSLVTAEVGSGGAVSASLSRPDEAADVYSGGYIAPSDDVMAQMVGVDHLNKDSHEALSKQIAGVIQQRAGSKWGLYISEIHQDENRRFVWLALASDAGALDGRKIGVSGRGQYAQDRLVNYVLDYLRRRLIQ